MTDWQRDLEDARATIEELTRERDSAKEAESWVRGQLRLIAESDAVRIEELTRERDEARASIERMKPVVDAALRWSDSDDSETEFALVDAVVAYESARNAT